jgi:hypothetical protein
MYAAEAVVERGERSGEMVSFPSGQISRTGSTLECGLGQYIVYDIHLREREVAIFRKHDTEHVEHNGQFGLVKSGQFDENIPSVQGNL